MISLISISQTRGVTIYDEVPTVTFSALLGALGGILNLWIGITFFTFIEVIELVYNLIAIRCKHPETQSIGSDKSGDDGGKLSNGGGNNETRMDNGIGGNNNTYGMGDRSL